MIKVCLAPLLLVVARRGNSDALHGVLSANSRGARSQNIRRSIKGERSDHFHGPKLSHISITPKSALTINPPKKVRRFLSSSRPTPVRTRGYVIGVGGLFGSMLVLKTTQPGGKKRKEFAIKLSSAAIGRRGKWK